MSEIAILNNEFVVTRTSKAGKVTTRGVLGVVLSGNTVERAALAGAAIQHMLDKNNLRGVVREVERVFPLKGLKKAPSIIAHGEGWAFLEQGRNAEGRVVLTIEPVNTANPNKETLLGWVRAIKECGVEKLKGEKKMLYELLTQWAEGEYARRAARAQEAIAQEAIAQEAIAA